MARYSNRDDWDEDNRMRRDEGRFNTGFDREDNRNRSLNSGRNWRRDEYRSEDEVGNDDYDDKMRFGRSGLQQNRDYGRRYGRDEFERNQRDERYGSSGYNNEFERGDYTRGRNDDRDSNVNYGSRSSRDSGRGGYQSGNERFERDSQFLARRNERNDFSDDDDSDEDMENNMRSLRRSSGNY